MDKKSKKDGKINGLQVYLYLDYLDGFENFAAFTVSLGAQVFISNKTSKPSIFEGFSCPAKFECNVAVSRVFSNRQPHPYSDCISDLASYDSVFTKFFYKNNMTYRTKLCYEYCYNRRLIEKCGCYDNSFSGLNYGNISACYTQKDLYCHTELFPDFFENEVVSNCSAECPNTCESDSYPVSISHAYIGSNNHLFLLLYYNQHLSEKIFNKTFPELQSNLVSGQITMDEIVNKMKNKILALNVYYEDLSYTLIEESPKTDLTDIISNVGGKLRKIKKYFKSLK